MIPIRIDTFPHPHGGYLGPGATQTGLICRQMALACLTISSVLEVKPQRVASGWTIGPGVVLQRSLSAALTWTEWRTEQGTAEPPERGQREVAEAATHGVEDHICRTRSPSDSDCELNSLNPNLARGRILAGPPRPR